MLTQNGVSKLALTDFSWFQYATDAILLLEQSSQTICNANPAAERLTGYSQRALLQTNLQALFPEGPKPKCLLLTKAGQGLAVSISFSSIPNNDQPLTLLIIRDLTGHEEVAQQIIQSEKLAAVGRLAASIAHHINNPLQAIHNSLHLLINHSLDEEKHERYLTLAQDEVEYLISVVQRMLELYRPSREGMRPTNLHELLAGVLVLVEQQLQDNKVQAVCAWEPDLPLVFAIGSHLKQVCLHLVFNALEAMPNGGTLTITTYLATTQTCSTDLLNPAACVISAPKAALLCRHGQKARVVVEFKDTGEGISPEELGKIFEPFYTTRGMSTGLGLATSYSIVEIHDGELTVSSTVGEGTLVRVALPVAE